MTGVWLNVSKPLISFFAVHKEFGFRFCSLCTTGVVRLHINNWLEVSFCLPHKIHRIGGSYIPPEPLERSLKAIRCVLIFVVHWGDFWCFRGFILVVWHFRPYHTLLLLESEKALLSQLPLDCSPAMVRLIKTCSAVKNLQQLAQDADLALLQVHNRRAARITAAQYFNILLYTYILILHALRPSH